MPRGPFVSYSLFSFDASFLAFNFFFLKKKNTNTPAPPRSKTTPKTIPTIAPAGRPLLLFSLGITSSIVVVIGFSVVVTSGSGSTISFVFSIDTT